MPAKLLWVEASPKQDRSLSSASARAFLDALCEQVEGIEVTRCNVWDADLPEFGREAALAKFAPLFGEVWTEEQEEIWRQVDAQIDFVAAHDLLLLSSPMWNWNVPYRLKQWIDVITQPLRAFTLDATGRHVGLIGVGKRAQLILTRSSAYDGRAEELQDHQLPYLEYVFGEMYGYDLAPSLTIEPTTAWTPEERAEIVAAGIEAGAAAGRRFAASL